MAKICRIYKLLDLYADMFVGMNLSDGTSELASQSHQHNESLQNISQYKSNYLFKIYLCNYFLIISTTSAIVSEEKSIIMLQHFTLCTVFQSHVEQ